MNENYLIGDFLKKKIEEKKIMIMDLAIQSNIHASTISRYINGHLIPSINNLYTLSLCLDFNLVDCKEVYISSIATDIEKKFIKYIGVNNERKKNESQ